MKRTPIRMGIVGLGKMGRNHLRVLSMLKDVELVFIYDANTDTSAELSAANGIPACERVEDGLKEVDAVVICTPTVTHAEQIRKAAVRVRSIFVEKPLADTLSESAAIHDFALREGLHIQVGFIERFNSAVQQLKAVLDRSRQVISVDFTRTNRLSSRITDVDVVTDLMVHDLDLAMHLNGPVHSVSAHGVAQGAMIDFASALLTHENGRFSRVQASRITEKKMRAIQATCADMFVDCELFRKEIVINRQSEVRSVPGEPYTITAAQEMVEVPQQEALLSELQAFVSLCRGAMEPGVPTSADGLRVAKICEEIRAAVLQ